MIGTRPEIAEETMRECAELGIKHVWMHRGPGAGSVSKKATEYGREHGIAVIDGGCPCMFGPTADFGHKAMRFVFTLTRQRAQAGLNRPSRRRRTHFEAIMIERPLEEAHPQPHRTLTSTGLADKRVQLVHGSPRQVNEYLFEDKPARTFERIAALADCDVLVFGHTHKPWIREHGGILFVNCGSAAHNLWRWKGTFSALTSCVRATGTQARS